MSLTRKVRSGGARRRHRTRKCPKGKRRKIIGQRRGRRGRITRHGRMSKKCHLKRRIKRRRRTQRRRRHRGGTGTTNYSNGMRPWTPQELALNAGF